MTDTAKEPMDDSKEELTEAELDQVAGGFNTGFGLAAEKKHTQPEAVIRPGSAVVPKTHTQPEKSPRPEGHRDGST
jgi:hypothetical protein